MADRPPQVAFGYIKREWEGHGAFLVCGGDSLTGFDFNRIRKPGVRVMVVNSSYLTVPWADAHVFSDWKWFDDREGGGHGHRPEFAAFAGEKINAARVCAPGMTMMKRVGHQGIMDNCRYIMVGVTVVSAALNALWHKRARWVGCLGLDGKAGPGGKIWHHEAHPSHWQKVEKAKAFRNHGVELTAVARQLRERGMEVFNCNPDSAHRMFPFASPEQLMGRAW